MGATRVSCLLSTSSRALFQWPCRPSVWTTNTSCQNSLSDSNAISHTLRRDSHPSGFRIRCESNALAVHDTWLTRINRCQLSLPRTPADADDHRRASKPRRPASGRPIHCSGGTPATARYPLVTSERAREPSAMVRPMTARANTGPGVVIKQPAIRTEKCRPAKPWLSPG